MRRRPAQERQPSTRGARRHCSRSLQVVEARHRYLTGTLPVIALLAMALVGLVGCSGSAKPSGPASADAAGGLQGHDHGQTIDTSPPVAPHNGVLDVRVDKLPPDAVEFKWEPTNLLLHPGQTVTLEIANNDRMQHNIVIQAVKVNRNLPVGKVTEVRFTAPSAGTYAFWCKYHLQMMKGTITVE
jgi:plastocyanin